MTTVALDMKVVRALRAMSVGGAAIALVTGAAVLASWSAQPAVHFGRDSPLTAMKPFTAIAFVLLGCTLLLAQDLRPRWRPLLAHVLPALAMGLGVATMIEHVVGVDFGIDELLFVDLPARQAGLPPGRMSFSSASMVTLLGGSLLLLLQRVRIGRFRPSDWMALLVASISLFLLLGHLYGVSTAVPIRSWFSAAFHTAIAFLACATSVLFLRPEEGLTRLLASDCQGGVMARRLVPAAVLVPAVVGWLRLQGQELGWYDFKFGLALFAMSNIACFVALVWWSGGVLVRLDESEEELRLERIKAAEAKSLRKAMAAAEQANADLEAFSYSVAHDLRTPLRAINGYSAMLAEEYAQKLDEPGRQDLRRIRDAANRMGELIDALLHLAQVTRTEIKRESVDLTQLGRATLGRLQDEEPERRVDFVAEEGLVVQGDKELLQAAVENLIRNAWKFTGKRPDARIELRKGYVDGVTEFYVRDNGVGFDMALASKLFSPFKRLHGPDEFHGTGIGLATVERIIRRHGGRVWAEGERNQGATFHFTLP